ncbi:LuxR C-terminal-related transcriptional regulator [Streptomyces canus]|uniref:LuxR family transcriptional regulator n=1 Tax=Streptomyces canus TaxID=58343 RepID=UPI00382785F9
MRISYARTCLLYGEWLRRSGRRAEARAQPAEAAEIFRRLDAAPLLARTRAEQELAGQQPRRDSAPARHATTPLTAQELRVVRPAVAGLTNREIGAQSLISPRTVGYRLANVFPELGIVSRADLARLDFGNGLRLMG